MVVVVGAQKKDRFHLLRDLWEIMGGEVVPLLLRKENICPQLIQGAAFKCSFPKKRSKNKKFNNIGFISLPLPTLLKDSLMA